MVDQSNKNCDHQWKHAGLWDGKTLNGKRTGGMSYQCSFCGERAYTREEVKQKGGTLDESTDIFRKPVKAFK